MIDPLSSKLVVLASPDSALARAQEFARVHGLAFAVVDQTNESACAEPFCPTLARWDATPYVLCYQGRSVAIMHAGKGTPGPVSASFLSGRAEHRRKFGGGKGQMIAKAVGLSNGVLPTVLDATAGTHSTARDDDTRFPKVMQLLRLVDGLHHPNFRKLEGLLAASDQGVCFRIVDLGML